MLLEGVTLDRLSLKTFLTRRNTIYKISQIGSKNIFESQKFLLTFQKLCQTTFS